MIDQRYVRREAGARKPACEPPNQDTLGGRGQSGGLEDQLDDRAGLRNGRRV
jgi:hypothetical protein